MLVYYVCFGIIAITFSSVVGQTVSVEGEPCYHIKKNISGTCKVLLDCKSAFQEVQQQILPQICGLSDTAPIVCCPQEIVGFKSRQKCLEYSKLVTGKCNVQINRTRELTNAFGREFPHMAILGYSKNDVNGRRYGCEGVLISSRYVLTGGSCWDSPEYGRLSYVRLGDLHLQEYEDDAQPQEFRVVDFIKHPENKFRKHNLGLIKLDREVEFTDHVRPICLHVDKEVDVSDGLLHTAWGYLNYQRNQHLRRIVLKHEPYEVCGKTQRDGRIIRGPINDDYHICAISTEKACYGEVGAPLQLQRKDVDCMYDLVGISLVGRYCSDTVILDVFGKISYYVEWIENIVWP